MNAPPFTGPFLSRLNTVQTDHFKFYFSINLPSTTKFPSSLLPSDYQTNTSRISQTNIRL
jgi:hypothetical protein